MIEMTMDRKAHEPNGREGEPNRKQLANETPRIPEQFTLELVQLFKLLSDETRLRILLALLHTDEMHVRALCDLLEQSQPAVSHHLALLRVAGLIDRRREGKHNFYHLTSEKFEELLKMFFSNVPEDRRQLHFKDYVLSYSPA
jgi:ArsR family transcriptional regulator, arsenate/arsenite/antimonite-responsive transcriptional repressor